MTVSDGASDAGESPEAWRLEPRGEVDFETASALEAEIDALVERGARLVVVDLAAVTFLDSSGLRALVRGARSLEELGGGLLVENASAAVTRVLELTDLLDRLSGGD